MTVSLLMREFPIASIQVFIVVHNVHCASCNVNSRLLQLGPLLEGKAGLRGVSSGFSVGRPDGLMLLSRVQFSNALWF